jgi:hypothetical protein
MRKTIIISLLSLAFVAVPMANAGGPTEDHPCYAVDDCKVKTSREEFSKCVKAHLEEANQIESCAEFRKDKKAYMEKHGIPSLESLFES